MSIRTLEREETLVVRVAKNSRVLVVSRGRPITILSAQDAASFMSEQDKDGNKAFPLTDEIAYCFRLVGGDYFVVPSVIGTSEPVGPRTMIHAGWSKEGVKVRDNYTCAYCRAQLGHFKPDGSGIYTKDDFDVEHVRPKSRGGKNSWLNTVCSCRSCNQRKGDRTPEQAGMTLWFKPYKPVGPFVVRDKDMPDSWKPYFGR